MTVPNSPPRSRTCSCAGPSISLGEIAKRIAPGSKLLRGREPQLAAHGWYHTDHTVFPYGVHLAVVRVDRDTGKIVVERFMVAYDVGRAVNPLLIEGQLVGGCVQGLGGALSEEFVYDERGEPPANPTHILQASIASDNKPQKLPDPAAAAPTVPTTITPLDLRNPLAN